MRVVYKTDSGKERDHNEDNLIVDDDKDIFILADGMGGRQGGEVASKIAVDVAYSFLKTTINGNGNNKDIPQLLKSALFKAHDAIKAMAEHNLNLTGMGTTLVLTAVRGNTAYICHAGDSRAYLIRENIKQITRDQTLANYLIEHMKKRPEDIPSKAWHTLIQAVGVTENMSPELTELELNTGDILLICSDGLSDMLNDGEIEELVQKYKGRMFNSIADALVEAANNKGGIDNITVVLMKYRGMEDTFWRTPFSVSEQKSVSDSAADSCQMNSIS
ncbi:MAG: serine/threonine-protein phosphatase [Desulfobacterales bacterium]|nr:serine/threonine-protein phosphatase [Desulfobacterales bacterium]